MTTPTPWLYGLALVVVLNIVAWLFSSSAVRMFRVPLRLAAYVILIVLSFKLGVWLALALWWAVAYIAGLLWWSNDRSVRLSKDLVMVVYGLFAWPITAPVWFVLDLFDLVYSLYKRLLPNRVPHYGRIEGCKQAAISGDARAQLTLGRAYAEGEFGLPQDHAESAKWYRKAAEQNHGTAQLNLGVCLVEGKGVEKNVVEGLMWIFFSKYVLALHPPAEAAWWQLFLRDAAEQAQRRAEAQMTEQQIAEARVMLDSSPLYKEFRDMLSGLNREVAGSASQPAPEKSPPAQL
jgi:hypothetical protein